MAEQENCPTPSGVLVIVGGKENKGKSEKENNNADNVIELEILKKFVGLISKSNPVVEVITTYFHIWRNRIAYPYKGTLYP